MEHDDHAHDDHGHEAHDAVAAHAEMPGKHEGDAHGSEMPGFLSADAMVLLATWIAFGVMAYILHRFAWKPILSGLDAREEKIRKSIEDAEKLEAELSRLEETRATMIAEAEAETKRIIAEARMGAAEVASSIEEKAADKAKILYENAERDIEAIRDKALAEIQNQQVDMVVNLAGRLVGDTMDNDGNRKLVDRLIAEMN